MRSLYLGCAMYQALHEAFNNVLNPQANTLKYVIGYYCIPLTYEKADIWSSKTEVICQNHIYTVRSRVSRYVLDFRIRKSKHFSCVLWFLLLYLKRIKVKFPGADLQKSISKSPLQKVIIKLMGFIKWPLVSSSLSPSPTGNNVLLFWLHVNFCC